MQNNVGPKLVKILPLHAKIPPRTFALRENTDAGISMHPFERVFVDGKPASLEQLTRQFPTLNVYFES
jgi:hypothetical protein